MRSLPFSFPRVGNQFSLNILGLGSAKDTSSDPNAGYAGFIGSTLIIFAFLSIIWGGLSPTSNKDSWNVMSLIFVAGLSVGMAYGFKMKKRVTVMHEFAAVGVGIIAGAIMLATQVGVMEFSGWSPYASSTSENIWLIMLAPVAETLAFNIALYHWFRKTYPEVSWVFIAVASDAAFALTHYYRYGLHPDFILILIILIISNTILTFTYDLTRNATAPMVGHVIVNFATAPSQVLATLESFVYIFMSVFLIVFVLYIIIGVTFKK